jgi:hypothetical protein
MPDIRSEFKKRADKLLTIFRDGNLPIDWLTLQLVNEFEDASNEELDYVDTELIKTTPGVSKRVRDVLKGKLLWKERHGKAGKTKKSKEDKETDQLDSFVDNASPKFREVDPAFRKALDDLFRPSGASGQRREEAKPQSTGRSFNPFVGKHDHTAWKTAPGYLQQDCAELSLNWPCTFEQAKKAHKEAARRTHPDCGGTSADFDRVQKAWNNIQHYFEVRNKWA